MKASDLANIWASQNNSRLTSKQSSFGLPVQPTPQRWQGTDVHRFAPFG